MLRALLTALAVPPIASVVALAASALVFQLRGPITWLLAIAVTGVLASLIGSLILQRAVRPMTWEWGVLIVCYDVGVPLAMLFLGILATALSR